MAMVDEIEKRHLQGLSKLAGAVSHKINNDLSGITCNLSLLVEEIDDGSPPEELRELVTDALTAAGHASLVLKNVFGLFRLEQSECYEFDLNETVADVVSLSQQQEQFAGKLEISTQPKPILVNSTPLRVQCMLTPLLINAFEASTSDACVNVETRIQQTANAKAWLDELPAGSYATITVRDAGAGFSHELGLSVFEPFVSDKGPGRGLGLALSHAYARSHRGTLSWANLSRGGAEVTVWLPCACT